MAPTHCVGAAAELAESPYATEFCFSAVLRSHDVLRRSRGRVMRGRRRAAVLLVREGFGGRPPPLAHRRARVFGRQKLERETMDVAREGERARRLRAIHVAHYALPFVYCVPCSYGVLA